MRRNTAVNLIQKTEQSFSGVTVLKVVAEGVKPFAAMQIIHGSLEYKERYMPFIKFLAERGYVVYISDLRGHGANVSAEYPRGHMKDVWEIIDDQKDVNNLIRAEYPSIPHILFGHSLGSIFARLYTAKYDDSIDCLILSGTANLRPFASLGPIVVDIVSIFTGGMKGHARILNRMSGLDAPTDEWLSYSKRNLENHRNDPNMIPMFTNGGFKILFKADSLLNKKKLYRFKNPKLPILSVTGEDDPVTGFKKGLTASMRFLGKVGYHNLESIVYPHMMHEVLNEDEGEKVMKDIDSFIRKSLKLF